MKSSRRRNPFRGRRSSSSNLNIYQLEPENSANIFEGKPIKHSQILKLMKHHEIVVIRRKTRFVWVDNNMKKGKSCGKNSAERAEKFLNLNSKNFN